MNLKRSLRQAAKEGPIKQTTDTIQTPPSPIQSVGNGIPAITLPEKPKFKPKGQPRQVKPKPPVVGVEPVAVLCGCIVEFELFELKKDKYREQRKAKLQKRKCKECRRKGHEEYQKIQHAEALIRRKIKADNRYQKRDKERRLPDQAKVYAVFDGVNKIWTVNMICPTDGLSDCVNTMDITFEKSGSGLFQCIHVLDKEWKAWRDEKLKQKEEPK